MGDDDSVPVLAPLEAYEARAAAMDAAELGHARHAVARAHGFRDWDALAAHVAEVTTPGSPVRAFELAVEAVVNGDGAALATMLAAEPALVRARSTRCTDLDPPVHGATLLHYLAANGVEQHRQRTPASAVAIGRLLLEAGAEVDALAAMYGGQHATLSMLVSSTPPAAAGLQVPLVHLLADAGAALDGVGTTARGGNVRTALVFGFLDAAAALVARGAPVVGLAVAAGLGRADDVERLLPDASAAERAAALSLAAMHGRAAIAARLLDAGADPGRFNPPGMHAHATPLHQAALAGHVDVVRLFVERGARLDVRDRLWDGTPLAWARHAGRDDVVRLLAVAG